MVRRNPLLSNPGDIGRLINNLTDIHTMLDLLNTAITKKKQSIANILDTLANENTPPDIGNILTEINNFGIPSVRSPGSASGNEQENLGNNRPPSRFSQGQVWAQAAAAITRALRRNL